MSNSFATDSGDIIRAFPFVTPVQISPPTAWQAHAVKLLAALFILSLPFKLATVHIAAILLAASLISAKQSELHAAPARLYLGATLPWLIPVLVATAWHYFAPLTVEPSFAEAVKAVARILLLGLAWAVMLERGWLSVRFAVKLSMITVAAVILSGYYDLYNHWSAGTAPNWNHRISGAVYHPNALGLFMALGIVLSAALLRTRHAGPWPWLLIILALPILWATGSRGSLIGTLAGLLCLVAYTNVRHLALLASIAASVWAAEALEIIDFQRAGSDVTRRALLELAIAKWREAPWFGWGVGTFPFLEGNRWRTGTHNVLLDMGVSVGVFAVLGWLYSTLRLLGGLITRRNEAVRGPLAMLVTLLAAGMVDYTLLTSSLYQGLWVLIAVHACWAISPFTSTARAMPANPLPVGSPQPQKLQ